MKRTPLLLLVTVLISLTLPACSHGPPDEPDAFVEWVVGEVEGVVADHLDVLLALSVEGRELNAADTALEPLLDDLQGLLEPYRHPDLAFDWRWPPVRQGLLELVAWVAPGLVPFTTSYHAQTTWTSAQEPPLRARVQLVLEHHPSMGTTRWTISLRRTDDGWKCDQEPRRARR